MEGLKNEGDLYKTEVKKFIDEQLNKFVNTEEDKVWSGLLMALPDQYYDYGLKKEYLENFFANLEKSNDLLMALRESPEIFNIIFHYTSHGILENQDEFESLIFNARERGREKQRNDQEKHQRILENPFATDQEYRLGTYKESLENQVRDAVLKLQEKGYLPMGSGFDNLVLGSQLIALNKEDGVAQTITDALRQHNLNALVKTSRDQIHIIFLPKNRKMSLEEWKRLWDSLAYCLPDISVVKGKRNSDNGNQGTIFREIQDKIKEGKNSRLGSGLAFVDGKVVPMTYQESKNL